MFSVFFATPSSVCSGTYSFHQELLTTHVCCRTNLHTSLYTVSSCTHPALAARIPLPILTLQIVFQMKASKQGDCSLQLQSGRCLGPVLYSLQGVVWNDESVRKFPPCQRFFSLLRDKTYIETRAFLAGYFVWWLLRYTAGARISR